MTRQHSALLVARTVLAAYCLATAAWCLLAYIPFTYHQVCRGALFPGFTLFARWHPMLYWPVLAAAVGTLPSLRQDRTRALTLGFAVVYAVAGVKLVSAPLLVGLGENAPADLAWCVVALTPLLWMAALDWLSHPVMLVGAASGPGERWRLFRACLLAGLAVWLVSSANSLVRYGMLGNNRFTAAQWVAALVWSLVSQAALFLAVFLALNLADTLAAMSSPRLLVRAGFYVALVAGMVAVVLREVVFAPLSFSGTAADLIALAVALSVVAFASGLSLRLPRTAEGGVAHPLALLLSPARFLRRLSRGYVAATLLGGGALLAYALAKTMVFDWAYMMQTLVILSGWMGAFAFFYVRGAAIRRSHANALVIAAAGFVCLYAGAAAEIARGAVTGGARSQASAVLDQYGDYEAGFRLARAALRPPQPLASAPSFYEFLAANTNLSRAVRTDPVDVELAGKLGPTAGRKPDIFLFVIDSLRRDYLSPYNAAVDFTPAIAAFAQESVVFQAAFTRYAGTGLSEPSIWAGGMLLHKQYVTPFYPMNSLQKLLDMEGYRQYITKDEILREILAPSPAITELDAGRATMNCELCQSLAELQAKIQANPSPERPIFAYTQPQNIHVSVINRAGRSVPDGQPYPGFDAAYASRVRALDKCFGEFIAFLKRRGRYDNSIVIVTSDHGDSLGEHGRWGHAYHVVPEVVRVPLLIHLPNPAPTRVSQPGAPAFLVDITPSLYYLLGHKPIQRNGIFGKPLFTDTAQEAAVYVRDQYLIASSYGPVYAMLSQGGHTLYVADGVEYKDSLYTLTAGGSSDPQAVSAGVRADQQQAIRDAIRAIQSFYKFNTGK